MARRAFVIINPAAGAGQALRHLEALWPDLKSRGIDATRQETRAAGQAVDLARAAAESGAYAVVVAAGGDGTAREVASGVLNSAAPRTPVALLPLGTGNDLAHLAGVGSLAAATAAIAAGSVRPWDAIEVNSEVDGRSQRTFALSFAAVGLAADVVRLTTPAIKRWFGPRLCYSVGFFRALARYRQVAAVVDCDGRAYQDDFLLICAGNTSHAGGRMMHLSPGAVAHDGLLNVSLIRATSRGEVARQFLRLLRGTHVRHPRADYFTGREIKVRTAAPADVQLDGDCLGCTPVSFRVKPGALQLLAPPAEP